MCEVLGPGTEYVLSNVCAHAHMAAVQLGQVAHVVGGVLIFFGLGGGTE